MESCAFCEIVAGRAPASIVYQDEHATAFMVLRPITPGHVVVVPNRHASQVSDMDELTGQLLFTIGMRLDNALRRSGLRCEGVNFFLADGAAAGQTVFHVHLHLFPRYQGDPFKTTFDTAVAVPREELDRAAARIRLSFTSQQPS